MQQYKIVARIILLILSVINFSLAAPISIARGIQEVQVDVVDVSEDVTTALRKRWLPSDEWSTNAADRADAPTDLQSSGSEDSLELGLEPPYPPSPTVYSMQGSNYPDDAHPLPVESPPPPAYDDFPLTWEMHLNALPSNVEFSLGPTGLDNSHNMPAGRLLPEHNNLPSEIDFFAPPQLGQEPTNDQPPPAPQSDPGSSRRPYFPSASDAWFARPSTWGPPPQDPQPSAWAQPPLDPPPDPAPLTWAHPLLPDPGQSAWAHPPPGPAPSAWAGPAPSTWVHPPLGPPPDPALLTWAHPSQNPGQSAWAHPPLDPAPSAWAYPLVLPPWVHPPQDPAPDPAPSTWTHPPLALGLGPPRWTPPSGPGPPPPDPVPSTPLQHEPEIIFDEIFKSSRFKPRRFSGFSSCERKLNADSERVQVVGKLNP